MWATDRVKEILRLRRKRAPVRCAYCHDDLNSDENLQVCVECSSQLHEDCWKELGRCATCGVPAREPETHPWFPHVSADSATCSACGRACAPRQGETICNSCWSCAVTGDWVQEEINNRAKGLCACGGKITQPGEERCYSCWNADTDMAFPESHKPDRVPFLIFLTAAIIITVMVVVVLVF